MITLDIRIGWLSGHDVDIILFKKEKLVVYNWKSANLLQKSHIDMIVGYNISWKPGGFTRFVIY